MRQLPVVFERLGQLQIIFRPRGRIFLNGGGKLRDALGQIARLLHLRNGEIQAIFGGIWQLFGVIQNHSAAIGICAGLLPLRSVGEQIARGLAPLNVMISRDRVDHIFGPPFGHVASDTIGLARVLANVDQTVEGGGMTLPADGGVAPSRLVAAGNRVRIVARGAEQPSVAFQKTGRAPQTVRRADQLEFVFAARAGSLVEVEDKGTQRLARPVGKRSAPGAEKRIGQGKASGFEMAHHAYFHLTLRA